jgi:hypothetical protein
MKGDTDFEAEEEDGLSFELGNDEEEKDEVADL